MDNRSFDDILRNSMDTPRDIPFNEGAWSRMAEQLPQEPSKWHKWKKFVPFVAAILGLMAWNVCLQQQVNQMEYLTQHETKRDTIFQKKLVVQIDTIYQVIEKVKRIYIVNEDQPREKEVEKNKFIYNSSLTAFSKNKNSALNSSFSTRHLSIRNGYTITPSLQLTPINNLSQDSDEAKADNEAIFTGKQNTNDVNPTNIIPIAEKAMNTITEEMVLTGLETLPIQKIVTQSSKIDMDDAVNWCDIYRPIVPEKRLGGIGLSEFKTGISNNIITGFGTNVIASFGIHLGAHITPNWTLELDFAEASGVNYLRPSGLYPNSYPYVDHNLIPSHYQLQRASLSTNYYQFALSLRRIWFKKEHIRPYAEIGVIGYKLYQGSISYDYGVIGESSFNPSISLIDTNYDMDWETPVFISAGLSTALFKRKVSFDIGFRYMRNFNPQFSLYEGQTIDGLGLTLGLNYHF